MNAKSSNNHADQKEAAARSPSPSALSTASSGSPLIRANSTSSSASSSSQRSSSSASSPQHQQARRPAPTSIAAAQLQQQLVKQPHNGNKLAHMGAGQLQAGHKQQLPHGLPDGQKHKCKQESKSAGDHPSKGLGYNLGKMIAYRASRFNEFWSVNKMRYMNLACLLMTLVCLITILLFSKSNVTETQAERQLPLKRLRLASATPVRLDGHSLAGDQEPPLESVEALERQPFVMGNSRRRSSADLDADSAALDEMKHEPADRLSGPFDDMLQHARRQLKRQQQIEREAEESSSSSGPTAKSADVKTDDANELASSPAEPNLARLFDDLDNFGLFKVIKSQLRKANLSQAQPTIVRQSPRGATIIMSLSGNSSALNSNGTFNPMASLLETLLPPMFRPAGSLISANDDDGDVGDDSSVKSGPRGFATLTIRSEPLFRGSLVVPNSPFAAFSARPSGPLVNPFVPTNQPMAPPAGGGLFGALLRATSELMADQMAQLDTANGTESKTSNSSNKDALSQQASHKATIVRLPLQAGANSTGRPNSSSSGESLDEEVETFDVGQMMGSRMGPPPFAFMRSPISPLMRSLFAGPRSGPASIIINSRSSAPDMMFEPPSISADFGSDSAPSPFSVLPSTPFAPSLMMPHMIMFGSSGAQSRAPPMVRALMAASKQMEQREKEAATSNFSDRRDDNEPIDTANSGLWREQFAAGSAGKLMPRHRSLSDSVEDESQDQAPLLSSVSSASSSFIENMLESTNGGPPIGRLSGTIKQIFRGPGMTVERIIELPSDAHQLPHLRRPADERGQVEAVTPGLRSQSISRLDDGSPEDRHKAAASERVASFAAQAQERNDASELEREFVPPPGAAPFASVSRAPVAGFISRLFSDLRRQQEPSEPLEGPLPSLHPLANLLSGSSSIFGPHSSNFKSQRHQRAFSDRSFAEDESESDLQDRDEQQDSEPSQPVWAPKMQLGSARIRLSPIRHGQLLPTRFAVAAEPPTRQEVSQLEARLDQQDNSRMQRAMKPPPIRSINEHQQQQQQQDLKPSSGFTLAHSSLFGFPSIKAPVTATGNKLQPRATETSARPFVYHSNHELAAPMGRSNESREQQQQQTHSAGIESRSSYQHRPSTGAHSVAGVPAAVGMGRRLDEGELIS